MSLGAEDKLWRELARPVPGVSPDNPGLFYLSGWTPDISVAAVGRLAEWAIKAMRVNSPHSLFIESLCLNAARIDGALSSEELWALRDQADAHDASVPDLIVCQQAAFHQDTGFSNVVFVNHVLHAGPGPYAMTVANPVPGELLKNSQATRLLQSRDTVVFDPQLLHSVHPTVLSPDAWLILLQYEFPLYEEEDRATLLGHAPPSPFDFNHEGYFEGSAEFECLTQAAKR